MRYLSVSSGSQGHPSLAITHINMQDCSVLYALYCLCSCNMVLSALQLASVERQRKDLPFSYCHPYVFLMPGMTQIWQQWGQKKKTSTQLNLQIKLFWICIILPFNGVWTARPRGMTLFRAGGNFIQSFNQAWVAPCSSPRLRISGSGQANTFICLWWRLALESLEMHPKHGCWTNPSSPLHQIAVSCLLIHFWWWWTVFQWIG